MVRDAAQAIEPEPEELDDPDDQPREGRHPRIMYIERKSRLEGPARIGRVTFSKSGKTLYYREHVFRSLKGRGFKSNYYDVRTKGEYWVSGVRKDRQDRLYGGQRGVEIDDDVRDEYLKLIAG